MDHVILNHGQVTWTTPELAPLLLTTAPHQREDVSTLERFNVNHCPTRQIKAGTEVLRTIAVYPGYSAEICPVPRRQIAMGFSTLHRRIQVHSGECVYGSRRNKELPHDERHNYQGDGLSRDLSFGGLCMYSKEEL
ncbi:uncharacterized protein TNCV_4106211 [Trichonephila clavipes]|nr:uncharacterized protein TNCV_4106211 [Trichonephila clavipes]